MRISGGVLAMTVVLAGAGCALGRPAPPPQGDTRYPAGVEHAAPDRTAPDQPGPPAGSPHREHQHAEPARAGAGGGRAPQARSGPTPAPGHGSGAVSGWSRFPAAPTAAEQARRLTARLDRYLRNRPGRISVAVYDRVTGLRYHYHERTPYRLADVTELDILLVLLLRGQGRAHGLTPLDRRLATRMIRFGDDRAAQRLYTALGGRPGLTRALRRLGIAHTHPGPGRHWKLTRGVATDRLRVLDLLTSPNGPVNERNRAFAAALLASDTRAHARGVGAATAARERVALRNGRLRDPGGRGRWTVTSAGRITSPSRDTLIAVLSDRNPGRGAGQATVERVATMVMDEVRRD